MRAGWEGTRVEIKAEERLAGSRSFGDESTMLQQGQKVACIDGNFPLGIEKLYVSLPKEGDTYTIRDVAPGQGFNLEPEVAVTLVEIHNPKGAGGLERSFNAERFAPLEEVEETSFAEEEIEVPETAGV